MAYEFEGYWKDVWYHQQPLGGQHGPSWARRPAFNIYGSAGRKIYARNYAMPSGFIAKGLRDLRQLRR